MPLLSKQKFFKQYGNLYGAPGSGAYDRYVRYVNKHRPQRLASQLDYLQPTSRHDMLGMAKQMVGAQINPLIAQITKDANARAARGMSSIRGLNNSYLNFIAPLPGQIANIYQAAGAQANQANDVMRGGQQAAANTAAGALGESAAQIGAPQASQSLVQAAQEFGNTSTGIQAARGASMAGGIADAGGGGTAYAATLPAIARLAGTASARQLQQSINASANEQRGQLLSQIPNLTTDFYQKLLDREIQKASLRSTYQTNQDQINAGLTGDILSQAGQDARTIYGTEHQDQRTKDQIDAANKRAAMAAGGGVSQERKIGRLIYNDAVKLVKSMSGKVVVIPGHKDVGTGLFVPAKPTVVGMKNNNEVSTAVYNFIYSKYPNAPKAWIMSQTLSIMGSAGRKGPNINKNTQLITGSRLPNKKTGSGKPG